MDVRFCEGRNHRREAQVRAADTGEYGSARSSEARVRRTVFSLDKDLHGSRQTGSYPLGSSKIVRLGCNYSIRLGLTC